MTNLKRALTAAGLDEAGIAAAFGLLPGAEAASVRLGRDSAEPGRAALVRLFVLGETVESAAVPVDVGELESLGLVERDGETLRSSLRLTPFGGLLFAHDAEDCMSEPDYVTGVSSASRTLAALTIREPVERALDLGTGCGVQALLASRSAGSVVATDVNPRALELAALNARLNDVEVDLREGSWFEPVGDELFDLIVSNPPFVISPDAEYVFRDGDLGGDQVSRSVVRGAAAHLREGGFATILCNWICSKSDETWQPLEPWVEGTGCDALLLAHETIDPFQYAAQWNEPLRVDRVAYAAAIGRWLAYYEENDVGALGFGAVVLRRRSGANWHRAVNLPRPAAGAAGDHVRRLFAAADAPLSDDRSALAGRYALVPSHRLEQTIRYGAGAYEPARVTMALEHGLGVREPIDAAALPVLFELDPDKTLAEAIAAAEAEPHEVLPTVRRLYEHGLLERRGA